MNQDRRQYPRLIPDSALLVSVDKLKRAFLCDVSEGGVAFEGQVVQGGASVLSLAFELPDGAGAIEAVAEVVWTCDSLHRTGVRFLELAEASRQRLRDWLSKRVVTVERGEEDDAPGISLRGITGAARNWILQEITPDKAPDASAEAASESARTIRRRARYPVVGKVLGLAAVCSAFVTLGYYLPALFLAKPSSHILISESPVRASSSGSVTPVRESSAPATSRNDGRSDGRYDGFVLQVGAMARKENAEALAERLRRQSFPAFVFEQGGDGLYRVDVGPYPQADYAHSVKGELTSAGFKTVLERRLRR
jgi:cell division septation protein DedD